MPSRRSGRTVAWLAVLVAVGLASGTPTPARAAESDGAMQLTTDGISLYKAGRYEEAIAKFEAAYALVPDANLLFNIARSHQMLGHTADALAYYDRFLAAPGIRESDRQRAQTRRDELARQDVPPPRETSPPRPPAERRSRALEWSLIGAGSAVLVTGAVFGGLALASHSEFEDETRIARRLSLSDELKTRALIADIAIPVGAAAVVAGTVLLLVLDDGESTTSRGDATPFVSPSLGGAVVGVSFR